MNIFEYVSGGLMLLACLIIVVVVLLQDHKNNLSSVTGTVAQDSFFGKNKSRTKEARLALVTRIAAIAFFVLTLAVYIFGVLFKG